MSNKMDLPVNETIEDEAIAWLIRLDGDKPLSQAEEHDFEAWLARSPAHREALKNLNVFWSHCNVLGQLAEPLSVMAICKNKIKTFCRSFWGYGVAATAAILLVVIGFTGIFSGEDFTRSNGLYVTVVGQQKTITLADGSKAQLNTNSEIQVDYGDDFRNIRLLRGEAHFEVAKNPNKPFRVYADSGRVEAIGTAFNVYLNQGNLDLLVTEGSVALASTLPLSSSNDDASSNQSQMADNANQQSQTATSSTVANVEDDYSDGKVNTLGIVKAGQSVILKKVATNLPATTAQQTDSSAYVELLPTEALGREKEIKRMAWRKGLLIFSGETLAEAVEEINRYIPVTIEVLDPELRGIEIGGQIQVGDTNSMFNALEANFGLRVRHLNYNQVQLVSAVEES
ncbi:MAG: FecR domain-containing protein [Aliiglaciecola sp.]|uniref:FecR family protein n=1 Tax=Aliiglaciecola sp. TaxID=1872441 RepID=UPI0032976DD2